jgi:hypothetical protein
LEQELVARQLVQGLAHALVLVQGLQLRLVQGQILEQEEPLPEVEASQVVMQNLLDLMKEQPLLLASQQPYVGDPRASFLAVLLPQHLRLPMITLDHLS